MFNRVDDLQMFTASSGGGGGKRKKPALPRTERHKSRQVQLPNAQNYILLRPGSRVFASQEELAAAAAANELREDMMFLYRHKDESVMRRSAEVPVWEGCFSLAAGEGRIIRAQKAHLRQAYCNSGRTDASLAWSFLGEKKDQYPYWVDRYAFCKLNQRDTKRRYEHAHKRMKK